MAKRTNDTVNATGAREALKQRLNNFLDKHGTSEAGKGVAKRGVAAPDMSSMKLMTAFKKLDPGDVSIESLHRHLHVAMLLELATIPPYLCAMYTIAEGDSNSPDYAAQFGNNAEVQNIIRSVLVEEMLHLTLAGNVLNAVGGKTKLNHKEGVPEYPTTLPHSERNFPIDLDYFRQKQVDTFLAIELPTPPKQPKAKLDQYVTIGQMYNGIIELLTKLVQAEKKGGKKVFTGDESLQIDPKYYYNSGGTIEKVTDLDSAIKALEIIIEQGEGTEEDIFAPGSNKKKNPVRELAHFYKFFEIIVGRKYAPEQTNPNSLPEGEPLDVKWDNVYKMQANIKTADYPNTPDGNALRAKSNQFNVGYRALLDCLQQAFNGEQERMKDAVMIMFKMKYAAIDLMRTPFPGKEGVNAGPSFEFLTDEEMRSLKAEKA